MHPPHIAHAIRHAIASTRQSRPQSVIGFVKHSGNTGGHSIGSDGGGHDGSTAVGLSIGIGWPVSLYVTVNSPGSILPGMKCLAYPPSNSDVQSITSRVAPLNEQLVMMPCTCMPPMSSVTSSLLIR